MNDEVGFEEEVIAGDYGYAGEIGYGYGNGGSDIVGYGYGGDEVGFSFKKFGRGLKRAANSALKATKSVTQNKLFQAGVGVLAVAFPAVGVPAAAAVAAANVALKKVDEGKALASTVNRNLDKLKAKAKQGDKQSAVLVNAMQVAIATRKAARVGAPPPVPVAQPGRGSLSTTPRRNVALVPAKARQVPTSLYAPTPNAAQLAAKLAGGGSPTGARALEAVKAGKAVEVPSGVVVLPGKRPLRGRRVWYGNAPSGVSADRVPGGHVVTRGGLVLSGQHVFVSKA